MKTEYCLGFVFTLDLSHVWLIRKERPDWQKGLLNGIGGHIHENEAPVDAMMREFREETGVSVPATWWSKVAVYEGPSWRMHVFNALSAETCKSMTDEEVCLIEICYLPSGLVIPNLHWLIPMCLWQRKQLHIVEP